MRILLDTHIFLWAEKDDVRLKKEARKIITEAEAVFISSISIWEIAIKMKLGKIDVDLSKLYESITLSGFSELPVNAQHALTYATLPEYHRDPFDRMLIAQAISEPLQFITADRALKEYSPLVTCLC